MNDYYLKTTDLNTMWSLLLESGLATVYQNMDGVDTFMPNGIALDIIGTIYKPTGNMTVDNNGFSFPEYQPVEGFHANIRGNLTEEQQAALPLIEAPATPHRVWA